MHKLKKRDKLVQLVLLAHVACVIVINTAHGPIRTLLNDSAANATSKIKLHDILLQTSSYISVNVAIDY